MTEQEIFKLTPEKSFVEFAESSYRVAGYRQILNTWFIEIYDEPPSDHVDSVLASSCAVGH